MIPRKTSIKHNTNKLSVQQNFSNQAKIHITAFLNISNNKIRKYNEVPQI
jgi:hypothetical protein